MKKLSIFCLFLLVTVISSCKPELEIREKKIYFVSEGTVVYTYTWNTADESAVPTRPEDPVSSEGREFRGWSTTYNGINSYGFFFPLNDGTYLYAIWGEEILINVNVDGKEYEVNAFSNALEEIQEKNPLRHIDSIRDSEGNTVTGAFKAGESYTTEGYDLLSFSGRAWYDVGNQDFKGYLTVSFHPEFSSKLLESGDILSFYFQRNSFKIDPSLGNEQTFEVMPDGLADGKALLSEVRNLQIPSLGISIPKLDISLDLEYADGVKDFPLSFDKYIDAEFARLIITNISDFNVVLRNTAQKLKSYKIAPNSSITIDYRYFFSEISGKFFVNDIAYEYNIHDFSTKPIVSFTVNDDESATYTISFDCSYDHSFMLDGVKHELKPGECYEFTVPFDEIENGKDSFEIIFAGIHNEFSYQDMLLENIKKRINVSITYDSDAGVMAEVENSYSEPLEFEGDEVFSLNPGEKHTITYSWQDVIEKGISSTSVSVKGVEIIIPWENIDIDLSKFISFEKKDIPIVLDPVDCYQGNSVTFESPVNIIFEDNNLSKALEANLDSIISWSVEPNTNFDCYAYTDGISLSVSGGPIETFEDEVTIKARIKLLGNTLELSSSFKAKAYNGYFGSYVSLVVEGVYDYISRDNIYYKFKDNKTPVYKIYAETSVDELIGKTVIIRFKNIIPGENNLTVSFTFNDEKKSEIVELPYLSDEFTACEYTIPSYSGSKDDIPYNRDYPRYSIEDIYDIKYEISRNKNEYDIKFHIFDRETGEELEKFHIPGRLDYSTQGKVYDSENGNPIGVMTKELFNNMELIALSDNALEPFTLTLDAYYPDFNGSDSNVNYSDLPKKTFTIEFEKLDSVKDIISEVEAFNAYSNRFNTAKMFVRASYNTKSFLSSISHRKYYEVVDGELVEVSELVGDKIIVDSYEEGRGISYGNLNNGQGLVSDDWKIPDMATVTYPDFEGSSSTDIIFDNLQGQLANPDYSVPVMHHLTLALDEFEVTWKDPIYVSYKYVTITGFNPVYDISFKDVTMTKPVYEDGNYLIAEDYGLMLTNNGNVQLSIEYSESHNDPRLEVECTNNSMILSPGGSVVFYFNIKLNKEGLGAVSYYPVNLQFKISHGASQVETINHQLVFC